MKRRFTSLLLTGGTLALLTGVYLLLQPQLGWPLAALADMPAAATTTRSFTGAIAVRVFRNPNRLDPMSWYRAQDFTQGNPSAATVDGFPGLEEGSSVYVSAPNYIHGDMPLAYVNMYLLSYGQGSDAATLEIARRLRQNWEFLANIPTDVVDGPPLAREKLRRDNERLTTLGTTVASLQRYRAENGSYPNLTAGSYLPGRTVSTWPSWAGALSSALGGPVGVDPVNNFSPGWPYTGPSACNTAQGFASTTCYAAPGTAGGGSTGAYQCPVGSHVFEYENAGTVRLYANFEFKLIQWPSALSNGSVNVGASDDCRSYPIYLDGRGPSWGGSWPAS
jgi:hypothetical protein